MNFIGGIVLGAAAVVALLFVRPDQNGEPRGFMRSWLVGQLVCDGYYGCRDCWLRGNSL